MIPAVYREALDSAQQSLAVLPDLEPRSALKQAGRDAGIPWGQPMQSFVLWAEGQLFGRMSHA